MFDPLEKEKLNRRLVILRRDLRELKSPSIKLIVEEEIRATELRLKSLKALESREQKPNA